VEFQGGDVECILHPERGPHASINRPLKAARDGFVNRIDAYKLGIASVILGAGRSRKEDRVLPGVGITLLRAQGDRVALGDELCIVHGEEETKVAEATALIASAYETGDTRVMPGKRVLEEMTEA
jgi:pyrimidine-nucleoside phosphorylase